MTAELIAKLQSMRPQIRRRWEALLRIERQETPLANPDVLVYMFDRTLDGVLAALSHRTVRRAGKRPTCHSTRNPMRVYFSALEQALLEALVLAQSAQPRPTPEGHPAAVAERTAAVRELTGTLRHFARRELRTFDQICEPPTKNRGA